jgi:hypothetical protein
VGCVWKKALYSGTVEHPRIVFFFFLQARPLLDRYASELVDPRLRISGYDEYEMHCMMHAASQCIKKDPTMRPRMTQVKELKPCCIILFPHQGVKNLHARRACILVERMLLITFCFKNSMRLFKQFAQVFLIVRI